MDCSHRRLVAHLRVIYGRVFIDGSYYTKCMLMSMFSLRSTLTAKSSDALQNPDLVYENVARCTRLRDALNETSPVGYSSDCTKAKPRMGFSNNFGGHVLGSTLRLEDSAVSSIEDIEIIIQRAKDEGLIATQVRVVMVKVNQYSQS
jgi:hypothetical protein